MNAFLAGLALALALAIGATVVLSRPSVEIPICPEDAVLVGAGSYEQGRWDVYVCGPAVDDYLGY